MDNHDLLTVQLHQLVQSMELEGYLDHQFGNARGLKEDCGPFFFAELIPTFCTGIQTVMRDITETLDQPVVDYDKLFGYCIKLKGSASCFGACRLTLACLDLLRAVYNESMEGCFLALHGVKQEYYILHSKLDAILQLERRIVSHEGAL